MKIKLFSLVLIFAFISTSCAKQVTGDDVVAAFKAAGLEAENPSAMTKDDYGFAQPARHRALVRHPHP